MNELAERVCTQVASSGTQYQTTELTDEVEAESLEARQRRSLRLPPHSYVTPANETNPLTCLLPDVRTIEHATESLRWRGVRRPADPNCIDIGDSIEAYAAFPTAYLATTEAAELYMKILSAVRFSLRLRNPCEIRYARFYWDQGDVMEGSQPPAFPDFLESLVGLSIKLIGVSGAGRTAFLQRLRVAMGRPRYMKRMAGKGPVEMRFVPMLVVTWPDCSTLSGLVENIGEALMGELSSSKTRKDNFAYFRGKNGASAVIAACIFLNLGLLVIDGGNRYALRSEANEVMDFISNFQRRSGIPVVVSGTYIFEMAFVKRGSKGSKFSTAHAAYFDAMPRPSPEGMSDRPTIWGQAIEWHWKLGHREMSVPCPRFLSTVVWDYAFGRAQQMCEALDHLHHKILLHPELLADGSLNEDYVRYEVANRLRGFSETARVLTTFRETKHLDRDDFLVHADHLPYEAFYVASTRKYLRGLT